MIPGPWKTGTASAILALLVLGGFGISLNINAILMPRQKMDHRIELTDALRRRGYFTFRFSN